MSYDLIFWRQERPIDLTPAEIYDLLSDGESPAGVAPLPVDQMAQRLGLAFPGFDYESGEAAVQTDAGSFEVALDEYYCSVMVYGPCTAERNTIVGIMAEFGCPLFDPQTDERNDDDDGTALGELPEFEGLSPQQERVVAEMRARIMGTGPGGIRGLFDRMVRGVVERLGQDQRAGIDRAQRAGVRSARPFPLKIAAWAVRDDDLYVSTLPRTTLNVARRAVRCFDQSWNERWIAEGPNQGITLAGDALYVTDRDWSTSKGYVRRIDRASGEVVWDRELRGANGLTDAATTDRLVVVGGENTLWALRRDNGKTAWTRKGIHLHLPPLVAEEHGLILAGEIGGTLHGLDPKTGGSRWEREMGRYAEAYRAAGAWWAGGRESPLERIDPETGDRLGVRLSPCGSRIVESAGRLYFVTRHSDELGYRMGCFEAATSKRVWGVDLPFCRGTCLWQPQPLGVRDGRLMVSTYAGRMYTLDASNGRMLRFFGLEEMQRHNPEARETDEPAVLLLPSGQVLVQIRDELLEPDL